MTQRWSNNPIMEFFDSSHLRKDLRTVAEPVEELAKLMDEMIPNNAEKSAGLRKLLEAKDCFVRAQLSADNEA